MEATAVPREWSPGFCMEKGARWRDILEMMYSISIRSAPEYTECWPCPHFHNFLNKYFLLASLVAGRGPQCSVGPCSRESTRPYLSTGISNLHPAQAEVVLGQLSTYVFSLLGLNKSAELGTISKSIRDAVDAALTDERDSLT